MRGRYAALSHCWGKAQPIKTTGGNVEQMKECIPWERLSAVFQNAVTVCRKLGIKFLWIDSLCIVQDSSKDWEMECSKMCEYYEHAHLTLSAASSPDGNVPFLVQQDQEWLPHAFRITDRRGRLHNFYARQCAGSSISQAIENAGPLATRAWVWQENILSTRLLSFTSSDLRWECKELACAEDGAPPRGLYSMRLTQQLDRYREEPAVGWHELVGTYSIRKLTFDRDRLPALGGVASKMNRLIQSKYLAGLWQKHLISDLCWSVDYASNEAVRRCPAEYLAPSWAWPSVNGPIVFEDCDPGEEVVPLATIVDTQCTVPGSNPYGAVSAGYLIIKARMAYLTVTCHTPTDCWAYTISKQDEEPDPMTADCQLVGTENAIRRVNHGEMLELEEFSIETPCIPIRKVTAEDGSVFVFVLVLQRLESGSYRRIGCASLGKSDWFYGASDQTVYVI